MSSANNNAVGSLHLLRNIPAEIRNQIWREVVQGAADGSVIHMSRPAWLRRENRARLNMTMACEQIYEEAHYMYFAENAFLFKLNDSRVYYRCVEPVANWLYTLSQVERAAVNKVVACTNKTKPMLEFAWSLATDIDMESGFVVGDRLDEIVDVNQNGATVQQITPFGHDKGHQCNRCHYEIIPKRILGQR